MKKVISCVLFIVAVIVILIAVKISDNNTKKSAILSFNAQFEEYKNRTLYGTDVTSIINKAIDNNDLNEVKKDDDGNYIQDDMNSIKIEIILLSTDKDGNVNEVQYPMETLQKAGLDGFITRFSVTPFECSSIEYKDSGRISKIVLKQLEI